MTRDVDVHLYRWLAAVAVAASGLIVALVACLGRMGAPRHLMQMVSDACLTLGHVASEAVSLALATLIVATVLFGSGSAILTLIRTRNFVQSLVVTRSIDERVTEACRRINLSRVAVVRDERLLAFTSGWASPTAFISTGTIAALDDDELAAVLAHEAHHARRGDPFRLYVARVMTITFFWLPIVRDLRHRYELASEVSADRSAIAATGARAPLARALLRFSGSAPDVAIAQISASPVSGERIRLLCEGCESPRSVSLREAVMSMASVSIIITLALMHLSLPSM